MEKKFYFLIILTFLIMIFGGISLWSKYAQKEDDWLPAVKFEPPENYVFVDTDQGKVVENKTAGIKFKVPNNWTVDKKEIDTDRWIINLLSPNAKLNDSGLLQNGCGISAYIQYDSVTANRIKNKIEDPTWLSGEMLGRYKELKIGGKIALETTLENPEWGQAVSIEIPENDKIYTFETRFLPEDTEECNLQFKQFLGGISTQ